MDDAKSKVLFLELKGICVPLLGFSRLESRTIPRVLDLLSDLARRLQSLRTDCIELKPALISYVFFPLSAILSRNEPSGVPDQVLERAFTVLEILVSEWWWRTCENDVWVQMVKLSCHIIGGVGAKGKGRERDEESRVAAVRLLLSLLRGCSEDTSDEGVGQEREKALGEEAHLRMETLKRFAQSERMIPVLGQTLNALLDTAAAADNLPLRVSSLRAVEIIIEGYLPDSVVPSILPGTASTMTRIALGMVRGQKSKGWVHSSTAVASLRVLDAVIIRSIGDEPCLTAGIIKEMKELEDLTELVTGDVEAVGISKARSEGRPYETARSPSWLRASTSQLLIALNSLKPLVSHPTPAALAALSSLALSILIKARLSFADARPLLLSVLLSLSNSQYRSVSSRAQEALNVLLSPSFNGSHDILQTLVHRTTENLTSIPRLLPSHAEAELKHVAGEVEAVCRLKAAAPAVEQLLGPTGHIEKWGWRLLTVLNFAPPISMVSAAGVEIAGLLDSGAQNQIVFPEVILRDISTRETQAALARMLRALGSAGGERCLYSVEWFVRVGSSGDNGLNAVAAMWCASRILEGVSGVSLESEEVSEGSQRRGRSLQIEKFARWVVRHVSEFWDKQDEMEDVADVEPLAHGAADAHDEEARPLIEYHKGLTEPHMPVDLKPSAKASARRQSSPHALIGLRKAFALQLISISAAILQARFSTLLIHSIYPILHSCAAADEHLSSTGVSTLLFATRHIGYATPGNLLLSNFDYALDALSRRLTRRWLDVDAARVFVILIRLVGRDIVQRAGDVVEECFNRLDEYHGYTAVVEGLVGALFEIVKVIEVESDEILPDSSSGLAILDDESKVPDNERFCNLLEWIKHRNDKTYQETEKEESPHETLYKGKEKELDPEKDEAQTKQHESSTSPLDEPQPTPTQALTAQIVSRSITLLTHGSPAIRTRILNLLAAAAPVLPASALLPSVHRAWPFITNRLADKETHVVAAATGLIAALARAHGPFMTPRIWEDVWPRFHDMLDTLAAADRTSALARRGREGGWAGVGTQSAFTHSHRLYRAMVRTMAVAVRGGLQVQDRRAWDVLLTFRRFLHVGAHEEVQEEARRLYESFAEKNADSVWLVLNSTASSSSSSSSSIEDVPHVTHLRQPQWDTAENVRMIFEHV